MADDASSQLNNFYPDETIDGVPFYTPTEAYNLASEQFQLNTDDANQESGVLPEIFGDDSLVMNPYVSTDSYVGVDTFEAGYASFDAGSGYEAGGVYDASFAQGGASPFVSAGTPTFEVPTFDMTQAGVPISVPGQMLDHAPQQDFMSSAPAGYVAPQLLVDDQSPRGNPIITFDHVSKIYPSQPNKPALYDVSLQIYSGEFCFLVGHSGSGKSTFIKLITRELKASRGHIYLANEDLSRMRNWRVPYLRRNIGCVFQDFKLLPNKTVFENVAFALEVIGKSNHVIKTQVPEVLRLVGLQDKLNKRPEELSGGEQQRVSIARAIVNRPPVLVCDEPTGNLDPQTSRGIMDLLVRINHSGTTVLVATHDREVVDTMRKRVIALDHGRLVRDQYKGVYGFDA